MNTADTLMEEIALAFQGVKLEDGIGVHEAECIDDYYKPNDEIYIHWRGQDERDDWRKVLSSFFKEEDDNEWLSSRWCFMDDQGRRFILPCFLIDVVKRYPADRYSLRGPFFFLEDEKRSQFLNILSPMQMDVLVKTIEQLLAWATELDNTWDIECLNKCLETIACGRR